MPHPANPISGPAGLLSGDIGTLVRGNAGRARHRSAVAASGGEGGAYTVTVASATAATDYTLRFVLDDPGVSFELTAQGASDAALVAAFLDAAEADPLLAAYFAAADGAGTSLVFTRLQPGTGADITAPTNPAAALTIAETTAPAAFAEYVPGRAAIKAAAPAGQPDRAVHGGIELVAPVAGATFDLETGHDDSTDYQLLIQGGYPGDPTTGTAIEWAGGDAAADTAAAAVAALGAGLPAGSVVGTPAIAGSDITIEIELPAGYALQQPPEAEADGSGTLAIDEYVPAAALPDFVFVRRDDGIAPRAPIVGGPAARLDAIPASRTIPYAEQGAGLDYGVPLPAGAAVDGQVYVETAAGANRGALVALPSPSAPPWSGVTWAYVGDIAHARI